ncbi:MAG: tetratricopeptide repeat protein [FCB group bacterium]|nr:tetratricopeptide repeat protein [FCB group bacterium]
MTYRNEDVISLASKMVFVKVNKKDTILTDKYGVAGYPTIVMAKADGSEIDRIFGYAPPEDFLTTIDDYNNDRNTLADYLRRVETDETMQLYAQIAEKYEGRRKYTEAETYYRKILQTDPNNKEGLADSALYAIGGLKTRAKEYAAAEEVFIRLGKTYPESELIDDAAYSMALCMRRADRFDDAITEFKKFIKAFPESELIEDAAIYIPFCTKLKGDTAQAIALFNTFLVDFPESSSAGWVKKQIESMENPSEVKEGS